MINATWLWFREVSRFFFAALAQKQPQMILHKSEGMLAAAGKKMLPILIAAQCAILVIVLFCFFWYWRPKRHYSRQKQLEYEQEIDLLDGKVGMLQMDNAKLTKQLAEAKATIEDLTSSMKMAVAFDKAITVTPGVGGTYTFIFVGCEEKPDGSGFAGFYACPQCSLDVSEGADPDTEFTKHLETCPEMNRALCARS
jgi:hypothetical protein